MILQYPLNIIDFFLLDKHVLTFVTHNQVVWVRRLLRCNLCFSRWQPLFLIINSLTIVLITVFLIYIWHILIFVWLLNVVAWKVNKIIFGRVFRTIWLCLSAPGSDCHLLRNSRCRCRDLLLSVWRVLIRQQKAVLTVKVRCVWANVILRMLIGGVGGFVDGDDCIGGVRPVRAVGVASDNIELVRRQRHCGVGHNLRCLVVPI